MATATNNAPKTTEQRDAEMAYRLCRVEMRSTSPYSQSHYFKSERGDKETPLEFDQRCWIEKAHIAENGQAYIPPMALKRSIDEAAKRLAIRKKGQTLFTKYIEAGTACVEEVYLHDWDMRPITQERIKSQSLMCDAEGKKGSRGGKMVLRTFPLFPQWTATAELHVFDASIPNHVYERCVRSAGVFVGLGRFRPENGGYYGRFEVTAIEWESMV